MKFSIVIPTYNGAQYVEQAIHAALCQTRPADEVIISDDNSKDDTLKICGKYADQIKIYHNENGPSGFVNGWNIAIAHATGDYIAILHQDDLLSPTFLEEIEKAAQSHPDVKHFFAPCNYIDQNGNIIRKPSGYCNGATVRYSGQEYANAYERIKNHIHRCPGVVTHKSIFEHCKYRSEAGHIADDDFFLRVGNYTDVVGILKPLASYREHSGSETGHLDLLVLNTRLLKDYHFQLEHASANPMLSQEIIETFRRWEAEYIHRLIVYGIKANKFNYVGTGLAYWLKFSRREHFGNIVYDIASLKKVVKDSLKRFRIYALKNKSKSLGGGKLQDILAPVIVAPHPDDEVIGCGGLIARLVAEGRTPHIVIMTGGEGSHNGCCSTSKEEITTARRGLTRKALAILGVPESNIHELDCPDGGIDNTRPQIERLQAILSRLKPDSVFVPHWGEGWSDHVKTAQIVKELVAKDTTIWEYCVWMWYYNVWRGLDWKNAAVLSMTPSEHELKMKAMDAYIRPLAPCGNPWSGVLPKVFVDANRWNKELYFKAR